MQTVVFMLHLLIAASAAIVVLALGLLTYSWYVAALSAAIR